jgi:hypothetical protein
MMAQDETDEGSVGTISVYKCSSAVENPESRCTFIARIQVDG